MNLVGVPTHSNCHDGASFVKHRTMPGYMYIYMLSPAPQRHHPCPFGHRRSAIAARPSPSVIADDRSASKPSCGSTRARCSVHATRRGRTMAGRTRAGALKPISVFAATARGLGAEYAEYAEVPSLAGSTQTGPLTCGGRQRPVTTCAAYANCSLSCPAMRCHAMPCHAVPLYRSIQPCAGYRSTPVTLLEEPRTQGAAPRRDR